MERKPMRSIVVAVVLGALVGVTTDAAYAACAASPLVGCATHPMGLKAKMRIKNNGLPADNRLIWKAAYVPEATPTEAGSGADDYEVCVYDAGTLIVDSTMPGGGSWTVFSPSYSYITPSPFLPDGIRRFKWINIPDGKFILRALNLNVFNVVGPPTLPITGPIVGQLVNNDSGYCFESAFATIINPGPPTARVTLP